MLFLKEINKTRIDEVQTEAPVLLLGGVTHVSEAFQSFCSQLDAARTLFLSLWEHVACLRAVFFADLFTHLKWGGWQVRSLGVPAESGTGPAVGRRRPATLGGGGGLCGAGANADI